MKSVERLNPEAPQLHYQTRDRGGRTRATNGSENRSDRITAKYGGTSTPYLRPVTHQKSIMVLASDAKEIAARWRGVTSKKDKVDRSSVLQDLRCMSAFEVLIISPYLCSGWRYHNYPKKMVVIRPTEAKETSQEFHQATPT